VPPVSMSGPSPAIASSASAGSSNIYQYVVTNNVQGVSFPITVSGLSDPVSRTRAVGFLPDNDCQDRLPAGPSTCTIRIKIAPKSVDSGQVYKQVLTIDYQGRYPLTDNISFSVTPTVEGCKGPDGTCRVFLSTTTTNGDISDGTGLTGPAAATCSQSSVTGNPFSVANCICNVDAVSAQGITGTFKAWLSTSTIAAPTNMSYDPSSTYTSIMPSGGIIADPSNLLTSGALLSPIVPDATLSDFAYTGTNPNGTVEAGGFTCDDWTTSSQFNDGAGGRQVATSGEWTLWENGGCNTPLPLYCFETPS
jgi:hypothetical protein